MRKLKIKCSKTALLTVTRSKQWKPRMVYILAANKFFKYKSGYWSRIIYIGTTGKGAGRPATSAVNKASQAFGKLYGVKTIEVHIATCGGLKPLKTWKLLESALIHTFFTRYFKLPEYNKAKPKHKDGLFSSKALESLIRQFER
jgi:hypothetical protein